MNSVFFRKYSLTPTSTAPVELKSSQRQQGIFNPRVRAPFAFFRREVLNQIKPAVTALAASMRSIPTVGGASLPGCTAYRPHGRICS